MLRKWIAVWEWEKPWDTMLLLLQKSRSPEFRTTFPHFTYTVSALWNSWIQAWITGELILTFLSSSGEQSSWHILEHIGIWCSLTNFFSGMTICQIGNTQEVEHPVSASHFRCQLVDLRNCTVHGENVQDSWPVSFFPPELAHTKNKEISAPSPTIDGALKHDLKLSHSTEEKLSSEQQCKTGIFALNLSFLFELQCIFWKDSLYWFRSFR